MQNDVNKLPKWLSRTGNGIAAYCRSNTKTVILLALLAVCIAGMIITNPFSMKVKTQTSDFQSKASSRFNHKMDLFTAMDVLREAKDRKEDADGLWSQLKEGYESGPASEIPSDAVPAATDQTESGDPLPVSPMVYIGATIGNQFDSDNILLIDTLLDANSAIEGRIDNGNALTYQQLMAKSIQDFDAESISGFKVRLILFLACILAFIVIVAFLKKIRLMLLIIGAVFMVFPFYWMITGSLKTDAEMNSFNFVPQNWLNFSNYKTAWIKSDEPFTVYFMNSIIVCAGSVFCVMVTTVLAAYAFARLKFPGRDVLFTLLLSMMMIPFELLVITNRQTIVRLDLNNNLIALIVPFISSIFYTYILRNFFMSVPDSLYHAATVDGCSNWTYLWKVMFPIAKPSLVTIILLNAMASWNSFMWPQLLQPTSKKRTLPWALIEFTSDVGTHYELLMAAATMVILPMLIMFLCARKQIVSGVSRGGIKG